MRYTVLPQLRCCNKHLLYYVSFYNVLLFLIVLCEFICHFEFNYFLSFRSLRELRRTRPMCLKPAILNDRSKKTRTPPSPSKIEFFFIRNRSIAAASSPFISEKEKREKAEKY